MKQFKRILFYLSLTSMPMLVMASNVELTQSQTIEILTKSVKKLIDEQKELKERINILETQRNGMINLPDSEITILSKADGKESKFQDDRRYMVYKSTANVRKEPCISSPIVESMNAGTVFEGVVYNNDWIKKSKGYVSKSIINKIENSKIKEYILTHATKTWNTPKVGKNAIETLEPGKKILIYDIELMNNWYKTVDGAFFQK